MVTRISSYREVGGHWSYGAFTLELSMSHIYSMFGMRVNLQRLLTEHISLS